MSTTTFQMPVPALAPPAPRRMSARTAYAALILLYLAAFGYAALEWTTLLLYTYGWFPLRWEQTILDDGPAGYIDGSALAWLAALAVCAGVVIAGRRRPFTDRSPRWRTGALIALAALVPPAVWAGWQAVMLHTGDLWWRVIQLAGVGALITVTAITALGPTRAELGLGRRRGARDAAGFHTAMRKSLLGIVGASALGFVVIQTLHPAALTGPVGAGSGQSEPWWYWALAYAINAVVEETVCTAWLFTFLTRAGRPRWEIYAAAAVLRIAFHLYMGLAGIGATVFAVVNIRLFQRTRRLAPLVAAHFLFDTTSGNGNTVVTLVLAALGVGVLVLPARTWPRLARLRRRTPDTQEN